MADETQIIRKEEVRQQGFLTNVEGMAVLILVVSYVGLTFFLLGLWAEQSGEIILGFCLFAQSLLNKFFESQRLKREARTP